MPPKYKIPLWAHQLAAIQKARDKAEFALFFEMGCGKSATVISILRERYQAHGGLFRTLILCPPIVIENWRREWLMHSYIAEKDLIALVGSAHKRADLIRESRDRPCIYITNYEALLMKEVVGALKFHGLDVLVCDESHKLKDIKAKRTKAALELAKGTKLRYILTGSPVLNSPMDLFSQFKILDNGETFGSNFFLFRSEYFYDKNSFMPREKHFPNWVPKPRALEKMNELIEPKSMRVKKEECLDLPPLTKEQVFVDLSPEQKRVYEDMRKDFISYLGGSACVAQLALTKALRLMQIVSGFAAVEGAASTDPRKNVVFDASPRIEALRELLSVITPGHKVIVWACWRENYTAIKALLGDMDVCYEEVHGDFNMGQKQEAVDAFTANPSCRVLLANPAACGTGVNLTVASYAIYYSRNFSLEQDIQSEARNHRGGSEVHEKITRIDIVAKGTIDELITKRLYEKQAMGEAILGELKDELGGREYELGRGRKEDGRHNAAGV